MTPTELRIALLNSGYDPIPLRGKRPDMMEKWAWQKIGHASPEQIEGWARSFPDASNTGVLAERTCFLDLDILNPEVAEACENYVREHYEERGVVLPRIGKWPKRGIPFRTDEPFKKITLPLGRDEEKIEFLANGQQFAAFGIHPDTREAYQWPLGSLLETKREDLPYIRQAEAEALVQKLGEIASSLGGYNPKPAKHDGGNGPDWEPIDIEDLTRQILSGESLHNSVLKIAGSYAARGSHKLDCTSYIGLAFTAAHQPRYGKRWDECCAAIDYCYTKELEKQQQEQSPAQPAEATFTAAWLQNQVFPEVHTVVSGVLVEGLTLFAGKPKMGKSWLMLHAAIAVAQFSKTLGELTVDGGDVLYCALEDTPRRLQDRISKLGCGWPARLHLRTMMPRLIMGGIKVITDWLDSVKDPRLVIIDTLELVRERPKNGDTSYASDYAAALQLRELANTRHLAIVVVHHLRKAEAEDPFDTVSGTLGLTGAPDAILILTRDGPGATATYTLRGKGRDLEELERPMVFDRQTCLWTIIGDTPKGGDPWQKKKALRVFKRALDNAILDHGETIKPWPTNPPVRAVKELALRAAFYKEDPAPGAEGDKREAHRKNFKRSVDTALGESLIATREIDGIVFFWPVS
jgi:hypothetical protein